jgi:iron(III) transport system ATP-binding protein
MREGVIVQDGTPNELYLHPADRFVATFLGEVNRLPSRVASGAAPTPLGAIPAPGFEEGAPVEVLVRPEGIRLAPGEGPVATAGVEACRMLGATMLVHLTLPDGAGGQVHLHARLGPGPALARGQSVTVGLDPERAFVFPPEAT